jgi:hypothetical protein
MGLSLESFDDDAPQDDAPSSDFTAGFKAGHDAAEAQAQARHDRIEQDLVHALSDTAFGFAEAEAHVLGNLQSLFGLVFDQLLPATLRDSLGVTLKEAIMAAAAQDAKAPVLLKVAPQHEAAIRAVLEAEGLTHLKIGVDPDLSTHAAFLSQPDAETVFDLDAALAQVRDSFANLAPPDERSLKHGS